MNQQRFMRAMEHLMENDEFVSHLEMIQGALNEGNESLSDDAKAGLDQLMIREYGLPFEQYLSEFYMKELLDSFSPDLKDWLNAPMHVEDLFSGCTKKELLDIAQEEFHLQALSALKKKDVIKRMTAELVSPKKLEDRLTSALVAAERNTNTAAGRIDALDDSGTSAESL